MSFILLFFKWLSDKLRIEKIEPMETLVSILDDPSKGSIASASFPSPPRSITSSCSSEA